MLSFVSAGLMCRNSEQVVSQHFHPVQTSVRCGRSFIESLSERLCQTPSILSTALLSFITSSSALVSLMWHLAHIDSLLRVLVCMPVQSVVHSALQIFRSAWALSRYSSRFFVLSVRGNIFVSLARRVIHATFSLAYRFCGPLEHERRTLACETIAPSYLQLFKYRI